MRIDDMLGDQPPEKVSVHAASSAAYREFYHTIQKCNPNEYLASGKKLLMQSGLGVFARKIELDTAELSA